MKLRTAIIAAALATGVSLWWAWAQAAPAPLPALVPAGPLLYLEARDFGALLRDWDTSVEKRTWLASANYGVFSRSHLLLRLADAQSEFAAAAGLPPDYALLQAAAGSNSAFALYDIGKLEFLYLTRLPSARVVNSNLWRGRTSFQSRRVGNVDYYVREDRESHRTAAFAYAGDLLLMATREDLIAGALELLNQTNRPALAAEPWFQNVTTAADPAPRDLRLAYNLDRLNATFQFRTHWIQRNVPDLREFSAGLSDLERVTGEFRERRVLLRSTALATAAPAEPPAGQLLALVPDTAGLYRAWAKPDPARAVRWIGEKLFGQGVIGPANDKAAPPVAGEYMEGTEADLELHIDTPPLERAASSEALQPIADRLNAANLLAMLEVSSTAPGDSFVEPRSALVLLNSQPWNAVEIRTALSSAANRLWTHSGLGSGFRAPANGVEELDGLGKIAFAVDGARLLISDDPALLGTLLARRAQPPLPGASYAAGWRHARELPNFERMMRLIDFPEIKLDPAADPSAREPQFFSENLASLGRVLGRVADLRLQSNDTGAQIRETLVYRMTP